MKKLLTVAFFMICFTSFGQVTKEIIKDVFVTFPEEPERIPHEKGQLEYKISTDDYLLSVKIYEDVLPNYSEYEKHKKNATPAQIEEFEGEFIDGFIQYLYGGNFEKSNFKLGEYFGRHAKAEITLPEIEIPAKINLKNVLINNTMIVLEGGYLYESERTNQIIAAFLNSLKLN